MRFALLQYKHLHKNVSHLIGTDAFKSLNSRIVTFVLLWTQLALYPRAASDDEANALIADKFANVIDDLLNSKHALFIHFGMYWYAIAILDSKSSAVAILFAKSRMIFSGQKVVSQRA